MRSLSAPKSPRYQVQLGNEGKSISFPESLWERICLRDSVAASLRLAYYKYGTG